MPFGIDSIFPALSGHQGTGGDYPFIHLVERLVLTRVGRVINAEDMAGDKRPTQSAPLLGLRMQFGLRVPSILWASESVKKISGWEPKQRAGGRSGSEYLSLWKPDSTGSAKTPFWVRSPVPHGAQAWHGKQVELAQPELAWLGWDWAHLGVKTLGIQG